MGVPFDRNLQNAQIQEELDKLKELNFNYQNNEEEKRFTELVADLEKIRKDWLEVLEKLNEQRNEYAELIKEVRQVRDTFVSK